MSNHFWSDERAEQRKRDPRWWAAVLVIWAINVWVGLYLIKSVADSRVRPNHEPIELPFRD